MWYWYEKAIAKAVFLRRGVAGKNPQQRPAYVAPDSYSEKRLYLNFWRIHALHGIAKKY